jgi:uncharacterized protein YgbK (DUF1537 family)
MIDAIEVAVQLAEAAMVELLLIADDMTGALDSGVKLAQAGVRTVATADVDCGFDLKGVQALVASTQSRHLPRRSL